MIFYCDPLFKGESACCKPYNYTYDILIYPRQLRSALEFVSKFPEQKMVIDHCAKPDIAGKKIDDWAAVMKEIAKHPNVYCKLSGLFTEAKWKEWSPGEFYPYLDVVFNAFGTERLLFGSDWPVILFLACMCNGKVCWRNTWSILMKKKKKKYLEQLP